MSFPCAVYLFLATRSLKPLRAGFWAALGSILRYPSALWTMGSVLLSARILGFRNRERFAKQIALGLSVFFVAVAVGGLADLWTYGKLLSSAPAYWNFNHPHGEVEKYFGNDSVVVYWRWFEFAFGPWLAPLFLLISAYALWICTDLLIFIAPYLLGHLWTPHREPRFMLPIMPFLILAIAEAYFRGAFDPLKQRLVSSKRLRVAFSAVIALHVGINFLLYPLNAWAQWTSSLGEVIRHYSDLKQQRVQILMLGDPGIDALFPANATWADVQCHWHRPPLESLSPMSPVWVFAYQKPQPECLDTQSPLLPTPSQTLARWLRVRPGGAWLCPSEVIEAVCPGGMSQPQAGEPTLGKHI